jgi:hypothetical protein
MERRYRPWMLLTETIVDPGDLLARTGWEAKPEGLCKAEHCVPAPGARLPDGRIDVKIAAERLRMPLVHDEAHGLWALGPASIGGHALDSAALPDLILEDRHGKPFPFASLRGRKAVLVAWSSY